MTKHKVPQKTERYHHGDLRRSLLIAAEAELIENGLDRFSLRSCAKRAGVSHAAPAHHFNDTNGLLHALVDMGHERLASAMRDHQKQSGVDAQSQLISACLGYLQFAVDNPQLFQLIYGARCTLPDLNMQKSEDLVFSVLVNAVSKLRGASIYKSEEGWSLVASIWSLVHGYAGLAAAGRMRFVTAQPISVQADYMEKMIKRLIA